MNKHLFKSLQKDKKTELDKLYNQYHRMKSFNDCIYKRQAHDNLTLSEYKCFWSWYYNSNVTAREAYHYTFEDEQSSFYLQNFRTYYVRNFRFCQISEIVNNLLTVRIL